MNGLIQVFEVQCVRMIPSCVDDGEGGTVTTWVNGKAFTAAITREISRKQTKADAQSHTETYTVTSPEFLRFHDIFSCGDKIYRVISNEICTPKCASFAFYQVIAEEWRLT